MKKAICIIFLFFLFPTNALADSIDAFYTNLEISRNGTINVTETIAYDFENTDRHGIYRYIPLDTPVADKFRILKIIPQQIQRDNSDEKYTSSTSNSTFNIKIGDAERTITGKHQYSISYEVRNAIGNYDDHDEIFWNATGTGWQMNIQKAITTITSPDGLQINDARCFTGKFGSKEQNCSISPDRTTFSAQNLLPAEGLTIVAAFPPNTFPKSILSDHRAGKLSKQQERLLFIALALFALALNTIIPLFIWNKYKKKNKLPPVHVNFDIPQDGKNNRLAPALAGTIDTAELDKNDVIATIFDLAIRKHLKITQETEKKSFLLINSDQTKYYFQKLEGEAQDTLESHEAILYRRLFDLNDTIEFSELNTTFYLTFQSLEESVYSQLVEKGFYTSNPKNRKMILYFFAIVVLFIGGVVLAFVMYKLAQQQTNRTELGDKIDNQIDGLKQFLQKMERNYKWQTEQLAVVEQMIPYAIAFGYIEKFMESLQTAMPDYQPTWYQGNMSFYNVSNGLFSSMNSSFATNAPSSSSGFSGGGSSGGGGGGGGGGSW